MSYDDHHMTSYWSLYFLICNFDLNISRLISDTYEICKGVFCVQLDASLMRAWFNITLDSSLPFSSHCLDLMSQKRTEILRNDSNKKIAQKRLEERTEKSSNTETSFWEWYIHTALPVYHQVDFHISD